MGFRADVSFLILEGTGRPKEKTKVGNRGPCPLVPPNFCVFSFMGRPVQSRTNKWLAFLIKLM